MPFPSRPLAHSRPPPVAAADTNGEEEYEVERVVAQRKRGRVVECLVQWVGYPPEENTWQQRSQLARTAADALADFDAAQADDVELAATTAEGPPGDSSDTAIDLGHPTMHRDHKNGKGMLVPVSPLKKLSRCVAHGCRVVCQGRCRAEPSAVCHCPRSGTEPFAKLCVHCKEAPFFQQQYKDHIEKLAEQRCRAAGVARAAPIGEE
jgi:hypothetical protein